MAPAGIIPHTIFRPEPVAPDEIRISIIIPAYNMGRLLIDTLESVFRQTTAPHEVIVINNGSTDDTESLIQPYCNRIDYILLNPNQGVSKARNAGATLATGNWFMFLDGDDRLFPGAVEALRQAAAKGGAGVVVGRVEQLDINTGLRRERSFKGIAGEPPEPARRNFWRSLIASPGAAVFHREVHARVGGFMKPWQPTEDRDYYLRTGMTTPFAFCDEFVLEKLYRADSMRRYTDIAVFWGLKVHFEFLDWCRVRALDTGFLETDSLAIIRHGLQRACENYDQEVIEKILDYARSRDVYVPFSLRLQAGLASWMGRIRKMTRTNSGE